ncbi:hypothetical protein LCGC14_0249610 [marine sediment metagenome]|uniref:Glycosyltransferase 2-like domain-containing protein n=1 Tax=marine sediment metagenome TaxID=412755 RepID=A0A0F9X9V3_9ZZZZ
MRKKRLDIFVHCWQFSKTLTYLLSSLVLHPPKNLRVKVIVACTESDQPTLDVIHYFRWQHRVWVLPYLMTKSRLFNRTIGRNELAKNTKANLVWFTDADYFFGEGCFDSLGEKIEHFKPNNIYFPHHILQNRTKEQGDDYVRKVSDLGVYDIKTSDFVAKSMQRAIGGIQIVTGNTARKHGYCETKPEFLRPVRSRKWNTRMFCADVWYRALVVGKLYSRGYRITLPNVYRIRQSIPGVVDTLE